MSQQSARFSPFELLYGRHVLGPMSVLKELRTKERIGEGVKTTYGYMLELRNKLEDTCRASHEELRKAKIRRKSYYDKKSRVWHVAVGERIFYLFI